MKLIALSRYTYTLVTLLLLAGISLIFTGTAFSYIEKWSKFDESLGHGFLIFAIVLVEILRLSNNYIPKVEKKCHSLLLVIIFLAFAHEVSTFWGILIFQQLCFYLLWLVVIGYVLGLNYLRHISFPLAFFLFAIPFWEFSNTFFVNLTTQVVTLLLSFSDLTVYIHQNFIETPYGIIEVAEGCSGIRYFQIGFALAVYAINGEKLSWRLKVLVILTGIALSIITNWIRVLGLIYIGYWSEMASPLMKEHDTYGFLLFFFVISGVIFLINWLRKSYPLETQVICNNTSTEKNGMLTKNFALKAFFTFTMLYTTSYGMNEKLNSIIPENNNNVLAPHSRFPILANFGHFTEQSDDYYYGKEKCILISRDYSFVNPGENVLPYDNIHNEKNYTKQNTSKESIKYLGNIISVKHIKLKNNKSRQASELLYWYEFDSNHMSNKYIAKLFEITYLLQTKSKMKLNVIWCSSKLKAAIR
jgi:exosortase